MKYSMSENIDININPIFLFVLNRFIENCDKKYIYDVIDKKITKLLNTEIDDKYPLYIWELIYNIPKGSRRFTSAHFGEDSLNTAIIFSQIREYTAGKRNRRLTLPNDIHFTDFNYNKDIIKNEKIRFSKNKKQKFDIITLNNTNKNDFREILSLIKKSTVIVIITDSIENIGYYYFWMSEFANIKVEYTISSFKWKITITDINTEVDFWNVTKTINYQQSKKLQNKLSDIICYNIKKYISDCDKIQQNNLKNKLKVIKTGTQNVDTGKESVDTGTQNVDTGKQNVDTGKQNVDTSRESVDTGRKKFVF